MLYISIIGIKKNRKSTLKLSVSPVGRSAHLLVVVGAGWRITVSIVVEAVEGIVSVVKHVCSWRTLMYLLDWMLCTSPPWPGAAAAAETPAVCPAALLCLHALLRWLSLGAELVMMKVVMKTEAPPPVPAALQEVSGGLHGLEEHLPASVICEPQPWSVHVWDFVWFNILSGDGHVHVTLMFLTFDLVLRKRLACIFTIW